MAKFERSEALRKKKEGEKLLRKQMKAAAREVSVAHQFTPPQDVSQAQCSQTATSAADAWTDSDCVYGRSLLCTPVCMKGNTRFDESLLSAKRKARFEEERVAADKAELGEMAQAAREREASSMARILGLVNKSMNPDAR